MNKNIINRNFFINKNERLQIVIQYGKPLIPLLEIQIADGCNLKCRGCSHFSNIADEYFMPVEQIKKDLINLTKKIRFSQLGILGGEPLLHPDLKEIIKTIREILPEVNIQIATNGLLVPQMTKEDLEFYAGNKVRFTLSKYPANSDIFLKILDILGNYDLIGKVYVRNDFRKCINKNGDSDIKKTYKKCYMKHCINIRNGRIYHCPFGLFAQYFNKKFNKNIEIDKGLDITQTDTKTLLRYIKKPISTCRWCAFEKIELRKWERSNSEVSANDWYCE